MAETSGRQTSGSSTTITIMPRLLPIDSEDEEGPPIRTDHLPVLETEFSILDYIYTWQAYIPMLALMASAPLLEGYVTALVIWEWLHSLEGWPVDFPPINWTAWVLRLPHIGVSILFAKRLVVGYIRAKEKRIRDELEGVQRSRHV